MMNCITMISQDNKFVGIKFGEEIFKFENGVGIFLRFIRTKMNMSLETVAQRLDKSSAFISQIERGERKASPQMLRQLSELFHIEDYYLLLLALDGVLTPEEMNEMYKESANESISTKIDINELLMSDQPVFYQSKELSQKEKFMILGALKIVL